MKQFIRLNVVFLLCLFSIILLIAQDGIELVGTYKDSSVQTIFLDGDKAYIGAEKEMIILDISNRTSPVKIGGFQLKWVISSIFVSGKYAYVADTKIYNEVSGIHVLDISNPATIMEVGLFPFPQDIMGYYSSPIYIWKNHAYISLSLDDFGYGAKILVLDVTNPMEPSLKTIVKTSHWPLFFSFKDNYAYYASRYFIKVYANSELYVLDIADPANPVLLDQITVIDFTGEAKGMCLLNNLVLVTGVNVGPWGSRSSIKSVDISNPNELNVPDVNALDDLNSVQGMAVDGNYAFLFDVRGDSKDDRYMTLFAYDISIPFSPFKVAEFELPIGLVIKQIVADSDYVYAACGEDGLKIFKLASYITQQPSITLDKEQLYFASSGSTVTGAQEVKLSNKGGASMKWKTSVDAGWLNVSPNSGTGERNVRISVEPTGLGVGTYNGTVTFSCDNASNLPQTVKVELKVYANGYVSAPFGYFETPDDGSTVRGSIPVTGWTLHDIGVKGVKIYRNRIQGEGKGKVFIGDAILVEGSRPDVEAAFPGYPNNTRAGWGYMLLTNFLPGQGNGYFTLHAVVTDMTGQETDLGQLTVYCDNDNAVKPFGAIDTPAQNAVVSGSKYVNFGWALAPYPNMIPLDGSTIYVWVDGIKLLHPEYNRYRSDIATLFPGYANSNGAVGFYYIDTTNYSNGVHTIQWQVSDNAKNTDGIGSRYFQINNTGSARAGRNNSRSTRRCSIPIPGQKMTIDTNTPLEVATGFDTHSKTAPVQKIYPERDGVHINIKELEPVEIRLGKGSDWTGWLIVNDEYKPLPIGSTMDSDSGVFSWMPGPGFVRDYQFLFVCEDSSGQTVAKKVTVNILPKFPGKTAPVKD